MIITHFSRKNISTSSKDERLSAERFMVTNSKWLCLHKHLYEAEKGHLLTICNAGRHLCVMSIWTKAPVHPRSSKGPSGPSRMINVYDTVLYNGAKEHDVMTLEINTRVSHYVQVEHLRPPDLKLTLLNVIMQTTRNYQPSLYSVRDKHDTTWKRMN